MATALYPHSPNLIHNRATTLSRSGILHKSPSPLGDVDEDVPLTRVKRMNTLKYKVYRSHPPLVGKSKSVPLWPNSFIVVNKDGIETESQEQSLKMSTLSSSSSSSSASSDELTSNDDKEIHVVTLLSPTQEEHPTSGIMCVACSKLFSVEEPHVIFNDVPYHIHCFKCGACQQCMSTFEEFLVRADGSPLCYGCSPVCRSCDTKILHNHVSVLKRDFHEECLSCYQCKRKFSLVTKIYANNGEPCCANCVLPVFNDVWSPTKLDPVISNLSSSSYHHTKSASLGRKEGIKLASIVLSPSSSTDSGVDEAAGSDEQINVYQRLHSGAPLPPAVADITLNPQLENLSRSITIYSPNNDHSLIRPSFSEPNLAFVSNSFRKGLVPQGLKISSLKSILFDQEGALLFVNYCVSNDLVEYIVFWLDVEHFRHFDGKKEDMTLFAHHIVTKYIGRYAEIPVPVTREIQKDIFDNIETKITTNIFNQAQNYIYKKMENELLKGFLQSNDGKKYLDALAEREMHKTPYSSVEELNDPIRATITNFDKRHSNTKYYVYEIKVEKDSEHYYIYRRYSEWYSLNQSLRKAFPLENFPHLPKKILLGRSQKRSVAEQRMIELESYLQGLLSMDHHIVGSVIIKKFFKQSDSDKEDEIFNRRIKELQAKTNN